MESRRRARGLRARSCLQGKSSGLPACPEPLCQGGRLSLEWVASLKALVPGLPLPPRLVQLLAAGPCSGTTGRRWHRSPGCTFSAALCRAGPGAAALPWPLHRLRPLLGVPVPRGPGAQTVPVPLWPETPCQAVPAEDFLVAALGARWALTPALHGVNAQKRLAVLF